MHSDSYFCTGSTHNVCQDYASHGVNKDGKAYAIVSDGCSGSPHTDFGSRFLTKSMQWALDNAPIDSGIFHVVDGVSQHMASSCNMDFMCLDATLLLAIEQEREGKLGVLAMAAGDGLIAARHRGRSYYDFHLIDFYSGYPAYASYSGDPLRLREYIKHTDGGLAGIRIRNGEDDTTQIVQHRFYPETGGFKPYELFFDKEKYDLVMLLSDGAGSFHEMAASETSKHHTLVKPEKVLDEMTDFKNLKGEFVVRRAKSFLVKTCVANRWTHHDDFSVAVVSMD